MIQVGLEAEGGKRDGAVGPETRQVELGVEQNHLYRNGLSSVEPIASDGLFDGCNRVKGNVVGVTRLGDVDQETVTGLHRGSSFVVVRRVELVRAQGQLCVAVIAVGVVELGGCRLEGAAQIALERFAGGHHLAKRVQEPLAMLAPVHHIAVRFGLFEISVRVNQRHLHTLVSQLVDRTA